MQLSIIEKEICKAAIRGDYHLMESSLKSSDFITLKNEEKERILNEALTFSIEEGTENITKLMILYARNLGLHLGNIIMENNNFGSPYYMSYAFGRKNTIKLFNLFIKTVKVNG